MYAMHVRSASATTSVPFPCARAHVSALFRRAVVSPVRLDSSISRSTASARRTSAGTRSPTLRRVSVDMRGDHRLGSPERYEVARDELVREEVQGLAVARDVAVVRDELVQRLERLLGTVLLHEADYGPRECVC